MHGQLLPSGVVPRSLRVVRRSIVSLCFLCGLLKGEAGKAETLASYDERRCVVELRSELGLPLGTLVELVGRYRPGKGLCGERSGSLQVQAIDGECTQRRILLNLRFPPGRSTGKVANAGTTLSLVGYEGFVFGTATEALEEVEEVYGLVQGMGMGPWPEFVVLGWREVAPVSFAPSDFLGRRARFEGTATSKGAEPVCEGDGWVLLVDALERWPEHVLGKRVEVDGVLIGGNGEHAYVSKGASWRLVELTDLVGSDVQLEAVAGRWHKRGWLMYRDAFIFLSAAARGPDWSYVHGGDRVLVHGVLMKERLPGQSPPDSAGDDGSDRAEHFVLKAARWQPADPGFWARFGRDHP